MSAKKGTVLSVGHGFSWLLIFLSFSTSHETQTDFLCLRQVKEKLEDPNGYLNNWDFNNKTEGSICRFVGIECWHQDESRVLNIKLQDMGLKGRFPLGLVKCSTMTGLDLSGNNLTGPLTLNISKIIPFVTELDLSDNHFCGPIPENLANCSYLNGLNLAHNRFNGSIPLQFGGLDRLHSFDVSYNNLSGQVPKFNFNISKDDYANNFGLCGYPLDNCTSSPDKSGHSNLVYKVGGVTALVTFFITVAIFACRNKALFVKEERGDDPGEETWLLSVTKASKDRKVSMFNESAPKMTWADVMEATDNFNDDNIIGSEMSGTIYKATLPDGIFLMVKRLHNSHLTQKEFLSEMAALRSRNHSNLVPLLGHCTVKKVRFLVYKYMANGNLHDHLHPSDHEPSILGWPTRLKIAIEVANFSAWLEQNHIHGKVSTKSILLDENYDPKLFELRPARVTNPSETHFSTFARGEIGYMGDLGMEFSIVRSFGTVLLELITGKKPSENFNGSLAEWVHRPESFSSDWLYSVIDKSLFEEGGEDELFEFFGVACRCVSPLPGERMSMFKVHRLLTAIAERRSFTDCHLAVTCE